MFDVVFTLTAKWVRKDLLVDLKYNSGVLWYIIMTRVVLDFIDVEV